MDADRIIKGIVEQAASAKTRDWEENVCRADRLAFVAGMREAARMARDEMFRWMKTTGYGSGHREEACGQCAKNIESAADSIEMGA